MSFVHYESRRKMTTATSIDVEKLRQRIERAVAQARYGWTMSLMPAPFVVDASRMVCGARWTEEYGLLEFRELLYELLGSESIRRGEAEELVTRYNSQRREFKSPNDPAVSIYLSLVLPVDSPDYQPYVKFEIGPAGGLIPDED